MIQGFLLIYGALSSVFWFSSITLNVFMIIQFRVEMNEKMGYIYHAVCWLVPLLITSILAGFHRFGAAAIPLCGVMGDGWLNGFVMFPLAMGLFPAFLCNIYIFIKIYLIARQAKRSIQSILKNQFRPLIFSACCTVVFIIYWIHLKAFTIKYSWLNDWFYCVAVGNGQDECSKISLRYLGLPGLLTAHMLLILYALGGIVVFFLRKDILDNLKFILLGIEVSPMPSSYTDDPRSTSHATERRKSTIEHSKEDLEMKATESFE